MPGPKKSGTGRILKQRYGIGVRLLSCEANSMQNAFVNGYDRVTVAITNPKFGSDAVRDAWAEAEKSWVSY